MSNRVKIIIGITVVFIFGIVGALLAYYFTADDTSQVASNENINQELYTPLVVSTTYSTAQEKIEDNGAVLVNIPENLEFIEEGANEIIQKGDNTFLVTGNGSFFAYDKAGNLKELFDFGSEIVFSAISPDGTRAIIKDEALNNSLVTFETGERISLPAEIQNVAWSPNGEKIAYQFYDAFDGINGIFTANPEVVVFEEVINFGADDPTHVGLDVFWPSEDLILWRPQSSGIDGTAIISENISTKKSRVITLEDFAFEFILSLDGSKIFYDVYEGGVYDEEAFYSVKSYDFASDSVEDTGLDALVEKCVAISNIKLVCAVAENAEEVLAPEVLIEYDIPSKTITPLTDIDEDNPVNYYEMRFIDARDEIVYINAISGQFSRLSLRR